MSEVNGNALLLVRLGDEAGGRVNPAQILARRPGANSRVAFLDAQDQGWLDGDGWVTDKGRRALAEWDAVSDA